MPESLLINYMEFANVGHVIEALRYALAYHSADPSRRIGVLLPSNSPWELASLCPFVHGVYTVSPMRVAPPRPSTPSPYDRRIVANEFDAASAGP
jgi:hypothetical protein